MPEGGGMFVFNPGMLSELGTTTRTQTNMFDQAMMDIVRQLRDNLGGGGLPPALGETISQRAQAYFQQSQILTETLTRQSTADIRMGEQSSATFSTMNGLLAGGA